MMPSPMQDINTRLAALEAKIDQILAQPAVPPEVNLEALTNMLSQILSLVSQININTAPQQVDLEQQAQQAIAALQQLQAQLQQQAQAIQIPE